MSKTEVMNSLIRHGMRHFATRGYGATSLREIANDAQVPLSAIHTYFGNKLQFYDAVEHRAWTQLKDERTAYLMKALSVDHNEARLRGIIYAIAYPTVRRFLGQDQQERYEVLILNEGVSERIPQDRRARVRLGNAYWQEWFDALSLTCPELSHDDIIWVYSFILGAINSWQLKDNLYGHLFNQVEQTTAKGARAVTAVTDELVEFCIGGVERLRVIHAARGKHEE